MKAVTDAIASEDEAAVQVAADETAQAARDATPEDAEVDALMDRVMNASIDLYQAIEGVGSVEGTANTFLDTVDEWGRVCSPLLD